MYGEKNEHIAKYGLAIGEIRIELADLIFGNMTLHDVLRSEPAEGTRIFSRRSTTHRPSGRTAGDVLH